jgi:predicted RND superfamily exporter protein
LRHWASWIARHPGRVLLGVFLASLAALAGIVDPGTGRVRLKVDPALNEMLPDDDAERRFYETLLERFGSDDNLVVTLHGEALFSHDGLERVLRLSERLEGLPGVQRVDSLATALRLRPVDGDLEVTTFLEDLPTAAEDLEALREDLLADPLRAGSLVSRDGRTTALRVTFEPMSEEQFIAERLDRRVAEAARAEAGDFEVWIAGTPRVKAEITGILMSELAAMVPAIVALMALLSYAFFRTWWGSVAPVVSVLLALLWTLGVMAWAGHALNIVTTLVPPLVLTVGFAYAIHVVAALQAVLRGAEAPPATGPREAVALGLERVAFPVAFTAFTTAAGFLSLTLNDLHVIRGFGLYSVVGVTAALAASLTATPALLALARPRPARRVAGHARRLDRAFDRLARFDLARRGALVGVTVVVLVVSLFFVTRIEVTTEVVGNFRADSPVRRSYEAINEHLGGANLFYVMVESPEAGAFEEPANLRALADLQDWLSAQPEIGRTTSMVDYLRVINDSFHDGSGAYARIPDSARLTAQLLLLGANDELEKLVDPSRRTATILASSTSTASGAFSRLAARIDRRLEALPPPLSGRTTGNAVLLTRSADRIALGQARSLVAACAMIGLILVLYFRSWRVGLAALVPNVLPVAVYFGALGLTGVTLNNATALMGSIVLGIAVDDTIHFIVQFRSLADRLGDRARAARAALTEVGRPVTYTTVVLCLGLLVVATSDLKTQAQFGALGAFTLAVAWLADVTLTPALCSLLPLAPGRSQPR